MTGNDIYTHLAQHLDRLPAGFPATESGVELRILKRLFTPTEAQAALLLSMVPETVADIAGHSGRDAEQLAPLLEAMSRKGLIFRSMRNGTVRYGANQFAVGIWEYQVNRLDEALIRDVNEYIPHLIRNGWRKQRTKQLRVVPVSRSVSAEMKIMPYEAAESIIKKQQKIVVAPCICRKEHAMVGKGCGKLSEACLIFGTGADYYEGNGLGRTIDQEEALKILAKAVEQGLVSQPGNAKKPSNICMCCGCCCQILKNIKSLEHPARFIDSNWYAQVSQDDCTACGLCAERCQMEAITIDDTAAIDRDRCIGCGLCVPACEFEALALRERTGQPRYEPPRTVVETYVNMARERGLMINKK
jgi:ferredoxin